MLLQYSENTKTDDAFYPNNNWIMNQEKLNYEIPFSNQILVKSNKHGCNINGNGIETVARKLRQLSNNL